MKKLRMRMAKYVCASCESVTNPILSVPDKVEKKRLSSSPRSGRILVDLIAEDYKNCTSEGDALRSQGKRSTMAGAGGSSPRSLFCFALSSPEEGIDGMAGDNGVAAVAAPGLSPAAVPPSNASGSAIFATFVAEDAFLPWSAIEVPPQSGPKSVPPVPHPSPEVPAWVSH